MKGLGRRPIAVLVVLLSVAAASMLPMQAALAKAPANCPPPAALPTRAEMKRVAADARDRGFLWRISKGGRSSYLYGTLHLGTLATSLPGPTVRDALKRSDALALELDMLDPDIQRRLQSGLQTNTRPEPLPPELAARLHLQLAAACLPAAQTQGQAPLLQIASLSVLAARRDGFDPTFGVDVALATAAHAAGQPVISLETPEAQIALLTDFSPEEERRALAQGLEDLESGRTRKLLKRTVTIWSNSRLAELQTYPEWCECLRDDNERLYMKRVLDDRNLVMAGHVARLHEGGQSLFVAVGSLHMIGARGLPTLLQEQGFELDRITPR